MTGGWCCKTWGTGSGRVMLEINARVVPRVAISGIESSNCSSKDPKGVPTPSRSAIPPASTGTVSVSLPSSTSPSNLRYARRYLDWNRLTFEFHATGSQSHAFDSTRGLNITKDITGLRKDLNLTKLYGCAPQTWCVSCAPFLSNGSIYSLLQDAAISVVVNESRRDNARVMLLNTGAVRFDLPKVLGDQLACGTQVWRTPKSVMRIGRQEVHPPLLKQTPSR